MALSWTVVIVVLTLVLGVCAEQVNYPAYPEDVREEHSSTDIEAPDATWQAQEGQFPYQLFIRAVAKNGGVTTCGGSIIHSEWGLTAAHCTALRTSLVIIAGSTNLSNADIIIETETWYNHPRFIEVLQRVVQPNDISLIKFGVVLEFSDNLRPIQLQRSFNKNHNYEDVRMINSGWGNTWTGILSRTANITQSGMTCTNSQDNTTRICTKERVYTKRAIAVQLQSQTSEYLNWAYMRGVSKEACVDAYNYAAHIQESTLCAVFDEETTQAVCLGDSGGPLTAEDDDGSPVLVGVTSFVSGLGCHTVLAPFGFIRPGHYHEWFANVTGINFDEELWINSEGNSETTTEGIETVTTSEPSTNENSSSEESSSETTTDSNIDWSTPHPTEGSPSDQTTETTPATDGSYPSTTEEVTIPESSTVSSTSSPVEETTDTTLVTEESYPSTTDIPTTMEPTSSSSQISESSTEYNPHSSTIEITTETTYVTEESDTNTTEELTTTESTSSSSESLSSEPSTESNTYASTSQHIIETTFPGLEETDITEQPSSNNETTTSEPATESNTQLISETTTTPGPEGPNPSTSEDLSTAETPASTNALSTSEESTKTSETTILDISFTRPNFETTIIASSSPSAEPPSTDSDISIEDYFNRLH